MTRHSYFHVTSSARQKPINVWTASRIEEGATGRMPTWREHRPSHIRCGHMTLASTSAQPTNTSSPPHFPSFSSTSTTHPPCVRRESIRPVGRLSNGTCLRQHCGNGWDWAPGRTHGVGLGSLRRVTFFATAGRWIFSTNLHDLIAPCVKRLLRSSLHLQRRAFHRSNDCRLSLSP
jgi:hypothetical protein